MPSAHGAKVHVTVNILAHNDDLPGVEEYLKELKELKPDALIIADPAIFELAKEICPEIERHISTQANNTNYGTYLFWWKQGAKRGGVCQRAFAKGDPEDTRTHSGGNGDRKLHSRRHVHFLFRTLPSEQLLYRTGCQPGSLHPSLPLEICGGGRDKARRVYACL